MLSWLYPDLTDGATLAGSLADCADSGCVHATTAPVQLGSELTDRARVRGPLRPRQDGSFANTSDHEAVVEKLLEVPGQWPVETRAFPAARSMHWFETL